MEIVHVGYRDIATSSDIVVRHQDRGHGTQKDGVATKESEEFLCRRKNLPRNTGPGTDDSSQDLTSADVNVLGAEGDKIVGCADGIGRNVDTEGNNQQTNGGECSSCATSMRTASLPIADYFDWVPLDVTISWFSSGSCEDAEKTDNGEDDGDDDRLDVLRTGLLCVSREIGDIETKCRIVTKDRVQIREECPSKDRAVYRSSLCDNSTVADGTTGLVQGGAEDCQKDDGCNDRFETEEILNLGVRDTQEWQLE